MFSYFVQFKYNNKRNTFAVNIKNNLRKFAEIVKIYIRNHQTES